MRDTDRQHFDSYRQKQQTVIDWVTGLIRGSEAVISTG
jgi:hypothetical protein